MSPVARGVRVRGMNLCSENIVGVVYVKGASELVKAQTQLAPS